MIHEVQSYQHLSRRVGARSAMAAVSGMKYSEYLKLVLWALRRQSSFICIANSHVYRNTLASVRDAEYRDALYTAVNAARGVYTFLPNALISRGVYFDAPRVLRERAAAGKTLHLRNYLRIEWLRRYIAEVEAAGN